MMNCSNTKSREKSLNRNVHDFSVDNFIDRSYVLKIQKYLMTKNNIK